MNGFSFGILLAGLMFAMRGVPWLGRRWPGSRGFLVFLLVLGVSALAAMATNTLWRSDTLGIEINRSWIAAYLLGVVLTGPMIYGLSHGLFGAPAARPFVGSFRREIPRLSAALAVGVVEEWYFRGVWGLLCRESFGPLAGALAANAVFILALAPWFQRSRGLNLLSLFGFGLSMSWAWQMTGSLAVPAGIHTAAYYGFQHWPRRPAGRSSKTWAYWLGGEDSAVGAGPVAVYALAAVLAVGLVRWMS